MKIEIFLSLAKFVMQKALGLLSTKNEDYSKGDAFGAYERAAKIAKILELDASNELHLAILDIIHKLIRLRSLGTREEKHESIEDSVMDIINHTLLYYGMWREREPKNER